jgi:hypothetical protein
LRCDAKRVSGHKPDTFEAIWPANFWSWRNGLQDPLLDQCVQSLKRLPGSFDQLDVQVLTMIVFTCLRFHDLGRLLE